MSTQKLLTDEQLNEVANYSVGMSLGGLWSNTGFSDGWMIPKSFSTFEGHKDLFLYCMKMLMEDGRLRLARNGVILEGSVEEQVERFRSVFPPSEEELDIAAPGATIWFYTEDCPGTAVWVLEGASGEEILDWT